MSNYKEKLIKINVLTSQGNRELERAKAEIPSGNFGKVRVLSRRAAGFYLTALSEKFPELEIGSNFITQIHRFSQLKDLDKTVKKACGNLSVKVSENEIDASASISAAEIIINCVLKKLGVSENKN